MHLDRKKLATVSIIAILLAGGTRLADCEPILEAPCFPDDCKRCYCLGPENTAINAPVRPITCNGDLTLSADGLYWNAHQEGMEYAIGNEVHVPVLNPSPEELQRLNNLINAKYEIPRSNWEFGYRFGFNYSNPCDGWDVGIQWTHFHTRSNIHVETNPSENESLIALWSAFSPAQGQTTFARDIETSWKVALNVVDLELGREFWISPLLSLRPFMALRYASLFQDLDIEHKGGSWSPRMSPAQDPFHGEVQLDNDYKGIGIQSGLDTTWRIGCGWALYGHIAGSILYGCFSINHDEQIRLAISPFDKTKILSTKDHFRASRAVLDLSLGVQWATLICDCKYGVAARLGWEHHLFFHQNQMWSVVRIEAEQSGRLSTLNASLNPSGENVFEQRQGNFSTQGWTLSFAFSF